ncbi:uncharacterized protein LOC107274899 [Cephus cinctus]|uniref:Uncharacterized protein LOC107274899 n=1 Tax=Cephus cinctus TaxID=211228 RepID=A0AAJ7CH57_CEPCN|nr:uncharacterized protein LOC107274899 [Cephus cinctus]
MKAASFLLALAIFIHLGYAYAATLKESPALFLEEVDTGVSTEDEDVEASTEDSFQTKCLVDGYTYSHSQTIPVRDPNSHCLCVAGEVYCWWQRYHSLITDSPGILTSSEARDLLESVTGSTQVPESFEASGEAEENIEDPAEQVERNLTSSESITKSESGSSSSTSSKTCRMMGREYHQGERLPHSTGNCVECSCGSEGRVECSPRDCIALRIPDSGVPLEIPGVPDSPDNSDVDFEVFDLTQGRGIDETF